MDGNARSAWLKILLKWSVDLLQTKMMAIQWNMWHMLVTFETIAWLMKYSPMLLCQMSALWWQQRGCKFWRDRCSLSPCIRYVCVVWYVEGCCFLNCRYLFNTLKGEAKNLFEGVQLHLLLSLRDIFTPYDQAFSAFLCFCIHTLFVSLSTLFLPVFYIFAHLVASTQFLISPINICVKSVFFTPFAMHYTCPY